MLGRFFNSLGHFICLTTPTYCCCHFKTDAIDRKSLPHHIGDPGVLPAAIIVRASMLFTILSPPQSSPRSLHCCVLGTSFPRLPFPSPLLSLLYYVSFSLVSFIFSLFIIYMITFFFASLNANPLASIS